MLGVPWYGHLYPCLTLVGNVCTIPAIPFRGCNCSDAASVEVNLDDMTLPAGGPQWDPVSLTPFYNINGTHQMWFDDARSLIHKYDLAARMGLQGVGMWAGDFTTLPAMWQAFDAYFGQARA